MKVVMLVENSLKENQQIKLWIETGIADVKVLPFHNTSEAEKRIQEYKTAGVVRCMVLDMFFPSDLTKSEEAQGQYILERHGGDIPIVLISKRPETTYYQQTQAHVPLLRLEKPPDFFPVGNPQLKLAVETFRKDLLEAVNCALLVGSLKGKVAQLSKKRTWQPLFETRTGKAAAIFLACL